MKPHHTLLTSLLLLLPLAACTTHSPADKAPGVAAPSDAAKGWPLPPGSVVEQAGTVDGEVDDMTTPHGSIAPDNRTAEERVPRIVERGYVLVGVNQSQNLLSFRDPTTGQLQGFEVDIAREIARDIFGDPDKVDFRYVDSTDFASALDSGKVDMVLRSMSVTAERQETMAFSTPYLTARKQLLALESSGIESVDDLDGKTVCVANMSTALPTARAVAPGATILKVRNWADCLVAVQQHQADALLGDNAILAGIAAQDPYTRLVGPPLSDESYGIVFAKPTTRGVKTKAEMGRDDTTSVVQQVNSTLERIRNDGTWWNLYNRWLGPYQRTDGPPAPHYEATEEKQ